MGMTQLLIVLGVVWALTAACVFALGYEAAGRLAERRERTPVPYWPTLEGCRVTSPFQGAMHPEQFEIPRETAATQAHREVEQIWREVEADPDRWRHQP